MHKSWLRLLAPIGIFYLIVSLALRLMLWLAFGAEAQVAPSSLLPTLAIGVITDIYQLVYLTFPATLLFSVLPRRLYFSRIFKGAAGVTYVCLIFAVIYLAAIEFFFFEEFDSRFNLVAVNYLIYPTEVFINLWESYPIMWYLSGALALTWLCFHFLWPLARPAFQLQELPRLSGRTALACGHAGMLLLMGVTVQSDRVEFSANRVAVEIGNNGLNSLFRAFRTQDLDFRLYYKTLPREEAYRLVRERLGSENGQFISASPENLTRRFKARPDGLGKMNVVVLCLESQGAGYVGAYGDKRGLSPVFDALAKDGLLFENVYATGTRTVRGLEAIAASFPPIPSESVVKRPGSEGMANWGEVMRGQGYHTSFLYGGYGYFDNMNHFFGSNGFNLSDRLDIRNPVFENIWGVSDQDLYHHAVGYYDQLAGQGQPFFSIVMSTSNHKPFTFPDGIAGIPAKGGGRQAGAKYADYAVGRFVEEARTRPWFNNTLLVIVADHDSRVYGRSEIPVARYRIPLLMYAPGKLAAGTIAKNISQLDIAPTVLDLLGLPYEAPFFGQSALQNPQQNNLVYLSHNHDVALFENKKLAVLGLHQMAKSFRYEPGSAELTPMEPDKAMQDLTAAFYQAAFDLFKNRRYKTAAD